ncbi:phBC6A51 family helix-turn-helix protein [Halalkalibacter sp. APA_J-10(15)]|uniref:phBC6A51 family helix-turn-helix protein n=1 Tax=Halalkalibacter sp. APA_J-10(15) TaxID=2933805 RepID=UPI001FF5E8B5|nr:phBC6A51 family helix-turn-helix protein [Halalkalibacter sp. APA_J-10(15)]MCK0470879.1 phBC6A51 family helix-turn-helix protein [Halalkalibacter sp. APA_J-10(15)]
MIIIDERKNKVINDLVEGVKTKTAIAKDAGISRQAIYDWLNDEDFRTELDRRLQQRKVFVEKVIDSKLEDAVSELLKLASTTENARVKAQVLEYIIDRGLGKPTSTHKIDTTSNNNKQVDKDILDAEFEEWEVDKDEE